jgi:hypothetical protein
VAVLRFARTHSLSASAATATLFGSAHTYQLPTAASSAAEEKRRLLKGQVDVALAPEELEGLDAESLKRKYQVRPFQPLLSRGVSAQQSVRVGAIGCPEEGPSPRRR